MFDGYLVMIKLCYKLAISTAFFLALSSNTHAEYWIDDGQYVRWTNGDANRCCDGIDHWQIRLFFRGEPVPGGQTWGGIRGYSAEEVQQRLNDAREAVCKDRANDCRNDWLSYFNILGPIAVIKRAKKPKPVEDKAAELISILDSSWNLFHRSKGGYGPTTKEYLKTLHDSLRVQQELERVLDSTSTSQSYLLGRLNSISREIQSLGQSRSNHEAPAVTAKPGANSKSGGLKYLMQVDRSYPWRPDKYYLVLKPGAVEKYKMDGSLWSKSVNNQLFEGNRYGSQYRTVISKRGNIYEVKTLLIYDPGADGYEPVCTFYEVEGAMVTEWHYSAGDLCDPGHTNKRFLGSGDITTSKTVEYQGSLVSNTN